PYPTHPYGGAVAPPEPLTPQEGVRRSSIARDVAIGVGLAAVVLGGFLAVKFLVLDSDTPVESTSSLATIRVSIPAGVNAALYVDDKPLATVNDKLEIGVGAGKRRIKLVGATGLGCALEMTLPAGKTTTLECAMTAAPVDSAAPDTAPGSGAATGAETPSAPVAGGSATTSTPPATTPTPPATAPTPPAGSATAPSAAAPGAPTTGTPAATPGAAPNAAPSV